MTKSKSLKKEQCMKYMLKGLSVKEVSALGYYRSIVGSNFRSITKVILDDIESGYDPFEDLKRTSDYLELRDKIRTMMIQEGFKNNLLFVVGELKDSYKIMIEAGDTKSLGNIVDKMHKNIIELGKMNS